MRRFLILFGIFLHVSVFAQKQDSVYQELFARAQSNLEEGAFKNAVLDLNQLVNSNYDDPDVFFNRGMAQYHLGEFAAAIEDFDKAFKEQLRSPELFGYRGLSHYAMKSYDAAGGDLDKALSLGFNDAMAAFYLGNVRFRGERYAQAIEHYTKAEQLGHREAVLYNNRGKAQLEMKKYEAAIKDLTVAIERDASLVNAYRNRSEANFYTKKWSGAETDARKTLSEDPAWNEGYLILGTAAFNLQKYPDAIEALKKAEARSAGNQQSTVMIAESYYLQEQFKEAAIYFDKVVRNDASDLGAWEKLGISHFKNSQFSNASKSLEKCTTPNAQGYLGMAYYETGKSEEAFGALKKMGSEFPEVKAYEILAGLQHNKELYSQAMSSYSRVIEMSPENAAAYLGKARSYLALRQNGDVHAELQKALEFDTSPEMQKEAGLVYFQANDYQHTVSTLASLSPKNEEINNALAISYYKLEQYEEAGDYFSQLKDTRGLALPIAVTHYKNENYKDAWNWFRKAETEEEVPDQYRYAYSYAAFHNKQYAKVLSLTDGMSGSSSLISIARMRAISAFETKRFDVALAEAQKEERDSTIARIGGLSAAQLKNNEQVISFLKDFATSLETLEPLAKAYTATGNTDGAISVFTELIKINPQSAQYHAERGNAYITNEQIEPGIADLGRALEIDPQLANARLLRGTLSYDLNDFETVIEDLEIVKDRDTDGSLYYMLGMAYSKTERLEKAIPNFEKAYDRGQRNAEMSGILATNYYLDNSYEKAIVQFGHAIDGGWEATEMRKLRARSYFAMENYEMASSDYESLEINEYETAYEYGFSLYQLKNFEKAKTYLTQASSLNDKDTEANFYLGNTEFRLKDYRVAIGAYKKAVENGMRTAILFNNLGKSYYNLGDVEASIPEYTKALDIDPSNARARMNRGTAFYDLAKYEESIEDFEALDAEEYPEVNPLLAQSFFELGEFQTALKYFNRSIDQGEKSGDIYHKRGRTLMALTQYEAALGDLNNAMAAGKKDAEVYLDRARVNIYIGNDPAAMKDLNEAISQDDSNPIAFYNRGYLRELQEKWNEAINDYRKVVELDPGDHRAYYSMANSMVSLGQVSAALDPIDKAIGLKGDEASYFKVKGNITYRLERPEEACGLWEKAVSLGDKKSNFYLDQYCK